MMPSPAPASAPTRSAFHSDRRNETFGTPTCAPGSELAAQLLDLVLHHEDLATFSADLVSLGSRHLRVGAETVCALTLEHARSGHITTTSPTTNPDNSTPVAYMDNGPDRRRVHLVRNPARIVIPLEMSDTAYANLSFQAQNGVVFTGENEDEAQAFARAASRALQLMLQRSAAVDRQAHLEAALRTRTVINLAVGVVMAQNRCTQEQAITILKRASSTRHVKLHTIAGYVVGTCDPDPPEIHFEN